MMPERRRHLLLSLSWIDIGFITAMVEGNVKIHYDMGELELGKLDQEYFKDPDLDYILQETELDKRKMARLEDEELHLIYSVIYSEKFHLGGKISQEVLITSYLVLPSLEPHRRFPDHVTNRNNNSGEENRLFHIKALRMLTGLYCKIYSYSQTRVKNFTFQIGSTCYERIYWTKIKRTDYTHRGTLKAYGDRNNWIRKETVLLYWFGNSRRFKSYRLISNRNWLFLIPSNLRQWGRGWGASLGVVLN